MNATTPVGMRIVRILKASVKECRDCHGKGCFCCRNKGYFVDDQSYDITLPARADDPPPNSTYYRRKAAVVCVMCESPELVTEIYCAKCQEINRDRVQQRQGTGEI